MANDEHVAMLKKGVAAWNAWRDENPSILPDLSEADLSGAILRGTPRGDPPRGGPPRGGPRRGVGNTGFPVVLSAPHSRCPRYCEPASRSGRTRKPANDCRTIAICKYTLKEERPRQP